MLKSLCLIICVLLITEPVTAQSISIYSLKEYRESLRREQPHPKEFDDAIRRNSKLPIEFRGSKALTNDELRSAMQLRDDGYATDKGKFFRSKFEYDLENVRQLLGSHGYLNAKIGEPKLEETPQGPMIVVPLEEGLPYRIGTIKVEGAKFFLPEQIILFIGFKTGDVANSELIRKALYESATGSIKRVYANHGYANAAMELEPVFKTSPKNPQEGIVDFTIQVVEGKQYLIGEVRFDGSLKSAFKMLGEQLLFRQGEVYCRDLIDESIERLNRRGIVDEIGPRDHIFRMTREAGTKADVSIRIREKKKADLNK